MVGIDMDVIGDLPGYKFILKAVLKAQIQQLIDQLAACTDEESVILTASVSDGSLSHLGSESGKSFLQENDDVKSKFLGYCLKSFHVKAQQERIQPLPSYRLVHQSRQTHHHVGATRANTCTFQRHQPYPSNRKAFKLASDSPVVPLAIVANTARDSKAFASATEGAELDEDAGTVSLDSEEQSDANESHFPKNDIQSNNTTKVDGHLVKEDNSAGEEGDNNDSVVGVRVKIESGVDYKQDQPAQDSGWDPDESIDLGQYSTEASGSSTGQVMENPMAHHNMEDDNFFESENVPHEDDNDASLLDKSSMEVSRKEEALAKKYECRVCGKTFKYKSTLKRHMNVHDTNAAGAQYKCGSCTLFFYEETQLLQHKTDKHASHLCVQCGKTFFSKYSLERHQTIHGIGSPSKSFKCLHPGCEKTFVRKDIRDDHTNTHGNLLPHECTNCCKRFNNRNTMKAHKNVCLGEKEYRCSMCDSKYCRPALLRDHVIAVHQKVELKCPKCGKDIVYKSNLQRHLKNCIGN